MEGTNHLISLSLFTIQDTIINRKTRMPKFSKVAFLRSQETQEGKARIVSSQLSPSVKPSRLYLSNPIHPSVLEASGDYSGTDSLVRQNQEVLYERAAFKSV